MDARCFPRGQDVRSENPAGSADPVQSTRRAGGVCFFAPGFFAQAKKGGSRRHGAKALDLDVAPAGRHQEQLAALAPSSALRAPSPASGRRAGVAQGAQAGVLSLRQVSLHKQRKVARAVTARKPLTLMSGEPGQQAGQDPPYEALAEQQAGQDPPCEEVTGDAEEQERLAALAPSSALRAPSPASGRRAGV